jgi:hypothetical protein
MNAQCVTYYTVYILNQEENLLLDELLFYIPVFMNEEVFKYSTYTGFCCHPPIMLIDLFFFNKMAVQMKRTINPETGNNIFISDFTKMSTKQEIRKCALKCT